MIFFCFDEEMFVSWRGIIQQSESLVSQEQIDLGVFDRAEKHFCHLLILAAKLGSVISVRQEH